MFTLNSMIKDAREERDKWVKQNTKLCDNRKAKNSEMSSFCFYKWINGKCSVFGENISKPMSDEN